MKKPFLKYLFFETYLKDIMFSRDIFTNDKAQDFGFLWRKANVIFLYETPRRLDPGL